MINFKLKYMTTLATITIVSLYSSALVAMVTNDNDIDAPETKSSSTTSNGLASVEHGKEQKVAHIKARDRFNLVRGYYETIPDITMITPLPGLYEELYQKDLAFIRDQIKSRPNALTLNQYLDDLHKLVGERYSKAMSFVDYNFLARHWTLILSGSTVFDLYLQEYDLNLFIFKKSGKITGGIYPWSFISAPGIVVPHVSPSGSVPIVVLNDGYGFFDKNGVARSVDFLAVGTHEKQNFDYITNVTSAENWHHDYEHLNRSGRFNAELFKIRTCGIAALRSKMQKELADINSRNQTALAFFDFFHENQSNEIQHMKDRLQKHMEGVIKLLDTDLQPTTGFSSAKQYETYVLAAKSLNLQVDENDLISEYRSYLQHLLAGQEILAKYAQDFDDCVEKDLLSITL